MKTIVILCVAALAVMALAGSADAVTWKTVKLYNNSGATADTLVMASGDSVACKPIDMNQYGKLAFGNQASTYFDPNGDDTQHSIPVVVQADFSAGTASVDTIAAYVAWSHDGTYWFKAPESVAILAKSTTATTPATGAAGGYVLDNIARECRVMCGARYLQVVFKEIDSVAGATKTLRGFVSFPVE